MTPKPIKNKLCRYCRELYSPINTLQRVCSPSCAISYTKVSNEKEKRATELKSRRETKEKLEKFKTKQEYLKDAQRFFNKYIRLRDANLPCISCGRFHTGQYHAGHYRTVGAMPALRYDENNVHKQCSACNNHLSGNIINYRINLINKIGIEKVEWLEGRHEPKKYSIDDIKAIKVHYKNLIKDLTEKT